MLCFGTALSVISTVLFGLAPAFQTTRMAVLPALKESGNTVSGGGHDGLRNMLLVLQVAFSTILLVGGGLFGRSVMRAWSIDLGFRAEGLLTAGFSAPPPGSASSERMRSAQQALVARLRAMPGFESAALASVHRRRRLLSHSWHGAREAAMQVVGVVGDSRYGSVWDEPHFDLYVADTQAGAAASYPIVRTRGNSRELAAAVAKEWNGVLPRSPLSDFRTADELLSVALAPQRLAAGVFGAFGLMAIVLASVGMYSCGGGHLDQRAAGAVCGASGERRLGLRWRHLCVGRGAGRNGGISRSRDSRAAGRAYRPADGLASGVRSRHGSRTTV